MNGSDTKTKIDEINAAYDSLMYHGNTTFNDTGNHMRYGDVRAKINEGRTEDAETILDGVPVDVRNGEWYFLKGEIFHKRGWLEAAAENYSKAVSLEPNNVEFQNAFNDVNNKKKGNFRREPRGDTYSDPCCGGGLCDICTTLACCDCLCSLCGR